MEELLQMWRGREFQVVGAATAKLREAKHKGGWRYTMHIPRWSNGIWIELNYKWNKRDVQIPHSNPRTY